MFTTGFILLINWKKTLFWNLYAAYLDSILRHHRHTWCKGYYFIYFLFGPKSKAESHKWYRDGNPRMCCGKHSKINELKMEDDFFLPYIQYCKTSIEKSGLIKIYIYILYNYCVCNVPLVFFFFLQQVVKNSQNVFSTVKNPLKSLV